MKSIVQALQIHDMLEEHASECKKKKMIFQKTLSQDKRWADANVFRNAFVI